MLRRRRGSGSTRTSRGSLITYNKTLLLLHIIKHYYIMRRRRGSGSTRTSRGASTRSSSAPPSTTWCVCVCVCVCVCARARVSTCVCLCLLSMKRESDRKGRRGRARQRGGEGRRGGREREASRGARDPSLSDRVISGAIGSLRRAHIGPGRPATTRLRTAGATYGTCAVASGIVAATLRRDPLPGPSGQPRSR